jgi:uncharacterized protein YciI
MKLYIYDLILKPEYHDESAWDDRVRDTINQHSEFLKRGIHHGRVMFAGLTETPPKDNHGLVLFEADNQDDAEEFMQSDPAIANGVMMGRAFPFKLLKVADQARKWQAW